MIIHRTVLFGLVSSIAHLCAVPLFGQSMPEPLMQRALKLHHSILTVDTHCDTPSLLIRRGWDIGQRHATGSLLGGDQDLPRMKEGGLAASFFAVYTRQGSCTPGGYEHARKQATAQLDALDRMFQEHRDLCERALTPDDAVRIHATGKRAIFLGMENGYPIGQDLSFVNNYFKRGIRYITLCHSSDNDICASATAGSSMGARRKPDTGLSPFGENVVRRMNELGIMVDVSHLSGKSLADVLRKSKAPVLASHSGARSVGNHPRNLTDEELLALHRNGGVAQVCMVSFFLKPGPRNPARDKAYRNFWKKEEAYYAQHALGQDKAQDASLEQEYKELKAKHPRSPATVKDLVDHIDHIVKVAGINHVGLGSDFDGGGGLDDCRDVTELPRITAELLRRGYSEEDIRKIWGGNILRVFRKVIEVAATLRKKEIYR